jgi:hypothetical protein
MEEGRRFSTNSTNTESHHVAFFNCRIGCRQVQILFAKPTFDFTAGGLFDPFDYQRFFFLALHKTLKKQELERIKDN